MAEFVVPLRKEVKGKVRFQGCPPIEGEVKDSLTR